MSLLAAAHHYTAAGFSVIATGENKRAIIAWKKYQTQLPTPEELQQQFSHPKSKGIAVICGGVSGGLEVIDIDLKNDTTGTLFERLRDEVGDIWERLYIVRTRSGGYHLYYRCEVVEGNLKLASRPATPEEIKQTPHVRQVVLIETRGEGGYVIAPPTEGYTRQTAFEVPVITADERERILTACRSFNEVVEEYQQPRTTEGAAYGLTPWADYNQRADVIDLLTRHGWTVVRRQGDRTVLLRPGNTDSKSSGDYHHGMGLFKVFTTSCQFEPGKGYRPFAVYAVLEHGGDFSAAARQLAADGYGDKGGNVERKVSIAVNRLLSAGHKPERVAEVLMTEHGKTRREAEAVIGEVQQERGETVLSFWNVNESKQGQSITIERHKLCEFLYGSGFHLYFYDASSTIFRMVQQCDGLVREATTESIKKFIKNYIQSLPAKFDNITPNQLLEVVMKGADSYFGNNLIEFIDRRDIDLLKDDQDVAFFPFTNGIVRVDREGAKLLTYGEVGKVVWQSQVIPFHIDVDTDFADDLCEFWRFIQCVAGEDEEKGAYLMSLIGYLLHRYKDPARPFAVILAEETEDEKKGGGTGKGILVKALSYMSNIERVDGKNFKLDKNFAFQRVGLDTKIIAIEDVRRNVDFEGFYSIITEGVTVEKKNKDELFIPYKDSPKILFTTNYTLPSTGEHAKRRQRVFEFSGFFTSKRTPLDYFGHKLFDDWDADEWNRFYNLMFLAVQFYLSGGVRDMQQGDKLRRKAIRLQYGEEFLDWWDNVALEHVGQWRPFREAYNNFMLANDFDKKDYSQKRFKRAIEDACEKFGYTLTNEAKGTERQKGYTIEPISEKRTD